MRLAGAETSISIQFIRLEKPSVQARKKQIGNFPVIIDVGLEAREEGKEDHIVAYPVQNYFRRP